MSSNNRLQTFIQYTALIVALIAVLATLFVPIDRQSLLAAGYAGVFVVALLSAMSLLPGPSGVAAFIAGGTLDPFFVSLVAGLGSAIGESTGYLAGYGSHGVIEKIDASSSWLTGTRFYKWLQEKVIVWMAKYPFITIFSIAAIPDFFVDVAGLIAGRAKYGYFRFLIAMFLGKSIRFAFGAYLGAYFLGS